MEFDDEDDKGFLGTTVSVPGRTILYVVVDVIWFFIGDGGGGGSIMS